MSDETLDFDETPWESAPGSDDDDVAWVRDPAGIFFSDRFNVEPAVLENCGAFDICVVSDLPVFIDPFLLFNSSKDEYRVLQEQILTYLRFLRDRAHEPLDEGRIKSWYTFSEVKQNWLGFAVDSNCGHGLGPKFAVALHGALGDVLSSFGNEVVTASSHVEKLALIRPGVGKDAISDLTTNLIKHYLLRYTSEFAVAHLDPGDRRSIAVPRAAFNFNTETWAMRHRPIERAPWLLGAAQLGRGNGRRRTASSADATLPPVTDLQRTERQPSQLDIVS